MESKEYYLDNDYYDCIVRAHRIACKVLLVFLLSYFIAVGMFWDWDKPDKHAFEIGRDLNIPNNSNDWCIIKDL